MDNLAATITDNNETATSGPSIQIVIDRIAAGTYQISRRLSANGFHNVVAELSHNDGDRLLNLINVGGAMQFITSTFTYSAPLEGASQGLQNLKACSIEASELGIWSEDRHRNQYRTRRVEAYSRFVTIIPLEFGQSSFCCCLCGLLSD